MTANNINIRRKLSDRYVDAIGRVILSEELLADLLLEGASINGYYAVEKVQADDDREKEVDEAENAHHFHPPARLPS